ncbi:hypothetical protein PVAP13_1NG552400 [Panicum virgatum]|uniref:AMP-dependent synthetase/ligase domain-containing protein n=1 Tax=Panicum virgatum TaxID=38727 RepID=A0A8T0X8X5_PANVG|nr:hypothetical protein PVAP13_1NG552400 [Panicum virgatum]
MEHLYPPPARVDVAAFVLSCLAHHPATAPAFVDAATGGTLSFSALHRAALSLASGLRLGDAVLVLSRNSLLLPQILLGALAAGAVVPHASAAVMIVAEPEAAGKVAGVGVPRLLTSRSPDPRTLSAEELIDGGDPTAPQPAEPSHDPRAFLAYSPSATVALTHADLVAAVAGAGLPTPDHERRVCLASLPMCSAHGLPLVALGLPAAGVTTGVVAAPDAAAALASPMAAKLSSLRRVMVVPTPFTPEARQEFRRRLPWVAGAPAASEQELQGAAAALLLMLTQTDAAVIQHSSQPAEQKSAATDEANSPVPPLKKIQKIILGDIFSRSTTSKILRKHPETGNRQAVSKL